MSDRREALKHGDRTTNNGILISTVSTVSHHGVPVAAEGDFATCPVCNVGGPVLNDASPSFTLTDGRKILVRGARVMCQCEDKPLVIPSQSSFVIAVDIRSGPRQPKAEAAARWPATSEKLAESGSPSLKDHPELICPNMSNEEFRKHILALRNEALGLIDERVRQLARWNASDQEWFQTWFGTTDQRARFAISSGLGRMRHALASLGPANFIRYSYEAMRTVGCVSRPENPGTVAEVCAPDTATHTIAIRLDFCTLRHRHPQFDSQLLTLVHEVSHFDDVFGSRDPWYSTLTAKKMASAKDPRTLTNADNIAGYVVCSE
ncbi:M35 family metallo-endopeptidase [Cupriavidus sp. 30B13]|uniref:M35 family metallo-endopeptidase n=1 Tax=Cupriavidus sp. 30B13 TaxID=3384241 RepID=UPI003B91F4B0